MSKKQCKNKGSVRFDCLTSIQSRYRCFKTNRLRSDRGRFATTRAYFVIDCADIILEIKEKLRKDDLILDLIWNEWNCFWSTMMHSEKIIESKSVHACREIIEKEWFECCKENGEKKLQNDQGCNLDCWTIFDRITRPRWETVSARHVACE
jgi:hypothetical protein